MCVPDARPTTAPSGTPFRPVMTGFRCYRSEGHSKCSEKFYQERVKEHLEGRHFEGDASNIEFFEDRMKRCKGEEFPSESFFHGIWSDFGPPGPRSAEEAEGGEPLDSDDEDEEVDYLQKVVKNTVDGYCEDEDAIERQLLVRVFD